uniref:RNA helicase n=1 Tax=Leptobrachium leishanense TaxID=445787 RepID=A0A8C5MRW6_9ANUR
MEEAKHYLGCIRHHIESIVRPSCVIPDMIHWLQKDVIEQIKCKEETGLTNAAKLFIDKLLELEAEGWYRGFLDGLRAAGYTGLCSALEAKDFNDIESLEEPRKLLHLIYGNVKSNIKPDGMVPYFQHILSQAETEEINQETRTKGDTAGAEKLINCLLRSDKKEWPKTFTLALETEGHTQALEVWASKREFEIQNENRNEDAMDVNEEGDDTCFITIQHSEEIDPLNSCLSAAPLLDRDSSSVEVNSYPYEPAPVLKLRKYQEELAQPAYKGKNTIICAPTGSGKTFVALSICERHLKSMPEGKKGKVLFMATKVPVYEQQKDVFCKYFEGSDYGVVGFCGETSENVPTGLAIENNDIIIMTPQILVNCLQEGSVSSVSIFTIMIFDECHNTIGSHPYNVIMFHYMDMKHGSTKEKCPQIVGLTASVGTGKSKNEDDATNYVRKLCASLDIEALSTVKENLEELGEVVYKPEKIIREIVRRQNDPFTEKMSAIMIEIEGMAKKVFPRLDSLSNIQNRSFGTQTYEQWIIDTQRKCRVIRMENKDEERRICQALFTYTEYLRKFNDALMINDDARTKDALDYLKDFIHNVKNGSYNTVEQEVTKVFEAKLPMLEKISIENLNPKLDDVQFILMEAYRENPQTRTLLFVKTRALVSALKKWIEETPNLSFLKPDMLIGKNKRNDDIGMSLPSQKGALESFKSDNDSKLLIATSVADEGIDIPSCNLVLLYEYVGNVTKMIQVRGRGRAKDSQCILVTSKRDEAEKERNNLLHEKLMAIAVQNLQNQYQQDKNQFLKRINQTQLDEKCQRDLKNSIKRPRLTEESKRLLCCKCKTFACHTDAIRVIQGFHHTVIDPAFKDRYTRKPHPKPRGFVGYTMNFKIFCINPKCQEEWGVSGTYLNFQNIPLIKIDKFVVESQNGKQEYFPKWIKVDFSLKEFKIEEISESFSASPEK